MAVRNPRFILAFLLFALCLSGRESRGASASSSPNEVTISLGPVREKAIRLLMDTRKVTRAQALKIIAEHERRGPKIIESLKIPAGALMTYVKVNGDQKAGKPIVERQGCGLLLSRDSDYGRQFWANMDRLKETNPTAYKNYMKSMKGAMDRGYFVAQLTPEQERRLNGTSPAKGVRATPGKNPTGAVKRRSGNGLAGVSGSNARYLVVGCTFPAWTDTSPSRCFNFDTWHVNNRSAFNVHPIGIVGNGRYVKNFDGAGGPFVNEGSYVSTDSGCNSTGGRVGPLTPWNEAHPALGPLTYPTDNLFQSHWFNLIFDTTPGAQSLYNFLFINSHQNIALAGTLQDVKGWFRNHKHPLDDRDVGDTGPATEYLPQPATPILVRTDPDATQPLTLKGVSSSANTAAFYFNRDPTPIGMAPAIYILKYDSTAKACLLSWAAGTNPEYYHIDPARRVIVISNLSIPTKQTSSGATACDDTFVLADFSFSGGTIPNFGAAVGSTIPGFGGDITVESASQISWHNPRGQSMGQLFNGASFTDNQLTFHAADIVTNRGDRTGNTPSTAHEIMSFDYYSHAHVWDRNRSTAYQLAHVRNTSADIGGNYQIDDLAGTREDPNDRYDRPHPYDFDLTDLNFPNGGYFSVAGETNGGLHKSFNWISDLNNLLKDNGISTAGYDHILYVFPNNTGGAGEASRAGTFIPNSAIVLPEDAGLGLVAHESLHTYGAVDLYDTDIYFNGAGGQPTRSTTDGGIKDYSVMAAGMRVDPLTKILCGWLTPFPPTGDQLQARFPSVEDSGANPVVYKLPVKLPQGVTGLDSRTDPSQNNNEYFLVENHNKNGNNYFGDSTSLGLTIWHVDFNRAMRADALSGGVGKGMGDGNFLGIVPIQAGGNYGIENGGASQPSDPFPGTTNNRNWYQLNPPVGGTSGGSINGPNSRSRGIASATSGQILAGTDFDTYLRLLNIMVEGDNAQNPTKTNGPVIVTDLYVNPREVVVTGTSLAPANVKQGSTNVAFEQLTFTNYNNTTDGGISTGPVTIKSIKFKQNGTSPNASDITRIALFDESNGQAGFQPQPVGNTPADTLIAQVSNPFASGNSVTLDNLNYVVQLNASNARNMYVVYDISTTAQVNPAITVGTQIQVYTDVVPVAPGTIRQGTRNSSGYLSSGDFPISSSTASIVPSTHTLVVKPTPDTTPSVKQGTQGQRMLRLDLSVASGQVRIKQLNLQQAGNDTVPSDVTAVHLYEDANQNGVVDAGDTLLGTASFNNVGGRIIATFDNLDYVVSDSAAKTWLITYDISDTATIGKTVSAYMGGNNLSQAAFPPAATPDIVLTQPVSGQISDVVSPANFPVDSGTKVIARQGHQLTLTGRDIASPYADPDPDPSGGGVAKVGSTYTGAKGANLIKMKKLILSAAKGTITVNKIQVDLAAGVNAADIASNFSSNPDPNKPDGGVEIYEDLNNNDTIDAGDNLIGRANISAGSAVITLDNNFPNNQAFVVSAGTTRSLIVAVDCAANATVGDQLQIQLSSTGNVDVSQQGVQPADQDTVAFFDQSGNAQSSLSSPAVTIRGFLHIDNYNTHSTPPFAAPFNNDFAVLGCTMFPMQALRIKVPVNYSGTGLTPSVIINSLKLNKTGSSALAGDLSKISLFYKVGPAGAQPSFDPSTYTNYVAGPPPDSTQKKTAQDTGWPNSVTFTGLNLPVVNGTPVDILITADVPTTATPNVTVGTQVVNSGFVNPLEPAQKGVVLDNTTVFPLSSWATTTIGGPIILSSAPVNSTDFEVTFSQDMNATEITKASNWNFYSPSSSGTDQMAAQPGTVSSYDSASRTATLHLPNGVAGPDYKVVVNNVHDTNGRIIQSNYITDALTNRRKGNEFTNSVTTTPPTVTGCTAGNHSFTVNFSQKLMTPTTTPASTAAQDPNNVNNYSLTDVTTGQTVNMTLGPATATYNAFSASATISGIYLATGHNIQVTVNADPVTGVRNRANQVIDTSINGGTGLQNNQCRAVAGHDYLGPTKLLTCTNSPTNGSITLAFSDAVDPNTAGVGGNYTIAPSLGTVTAAMVDPKTVMLTTSGVQVSGTNYKITVTTPNGAKDLAGNDIDPTNNSCTFVGADFSKPKIASCTVTSGNKGTTTGIVTITFNKDVNAAEAQNGASYSIASPTAVFATFSPSGTGTYVSATKTVTFSNQAIDDRHQNQSYTITVAANSIHDTTPATNVIDASVTCNGTVIDKTQPWVVSCTATSGDGTTGGVVTVTFNEEMDPTTTQNGANYTISSPTNAFAQFALSGTGVYDTKGSKTVTFTGQNIGIPHQGQAYTLVVSSSVLDKAGNAVLASQNSCTGGTIVDKTKPVIVACAEVPNNNTAATVTFSEKIDPTTVVNGNFVVTDSNKNVLGTISVTLDGTQTIVTVTTDPAKPHASGSTYTITVNNVKDQAAPPNTIAANSSCTFVGGVTNPPSITACDLASHHALVTFAGNIPAGEAQKPANWVIYSGTVGNKIAVAINNPADPILKIDNVAVVTNPTAGVTVVNLPIQGNGSSGQVPLGTAYTIRYTGKDNNGSVPANGLAECTGTSRLGIQRANATSTNVNVIFGTPVNAAAAANVTSFTLLNANGASISIRKAIYDATTNTTTLSDFDPRLANGELFTVRINNFARFTNNNTAIATAAGDPIRSYDAEWGDLAIASPILIKQCRAEAGTGAGTNTVVVVFSADAMIGGGSNAADNPANYVLESPVGTPVKITSVTKATQADFQVLKRYSWGTIDLVQDDPSLSNDVFILNGPFTPALIEEQTYKVTVHKIQSAAGAAINENGGDNVWNGKIEDTTLPKVVGCSAGNNNVTITFSEDVVNAATSSNYTLESPIGTPIDLTRGASIAYSSLTKTATISSVSLATGNTFKVTALSVSPPLVDVNIVDKADVKNVTGNPNPVDTSINATTGLANNVCQGTVVDNQPPRIDSCLADQSSFSLQYSKAVVQSDAQTAANYVLNGAALPANANITYNQTTHVVVISNITLVVGTTASITVANVRDLAGNVIPNDGVNNACSRTVQDTQPPTIASCSAVKTQFTLIFSKQVNGTDAVTKTNFKLESPTGTTVDLSPGSILFNYDNNAKTLAISPLALGDNASYKMTVTNVRDLAGNVIANDGVGNVCSGTVPNSTLPTVTGASATNSSVTVTFSEAMTTAPAQDRNNFKVQTGPDLKTLSDVNISTATIAYDNVNHATTISGLVLTTGYLVKVTVVNATDTAGNAIANDGVSNVGIAAVKDTTPPKVVSCDGRPTALKVTFSKAVQSGAGAGGALNPSNYRVEIPPGSPTPVDLSKATLTYDAGTFTTTISGLSLVVNNNYKIIVTSVQDLAGNSISPPVVTGDNTCSGVIQSNIPPTVVGCSAGTKFVAVTFSESVVQAEAQSISNIQVTSPSGGTPISLSGATLKYDDVSHTTTITGINLTQGATFTVTVQGVHDKAGNLIVNDGTSNVCTGTVADDVPPTVVSCQANNNSVSVTFSEAVQSTGAQTPANFAIEAPVGTAITLGKSDTVIFDSKSNTTTITFATTILPTGAQCKVTVSNVRDIAGNVIGAPNSCTSVVTDSIAPTVVSCSADTSMLQVVFSEAVRSGVAPESATTNSNYDIESPVGSPLPNAVIAGAGLTYNNTTLTVTFTGLGLIPGNTFKVTVHRVQDIAGVAINENGVDNVCTGTLPLIIKPDGLIQKVSPASDAFIGAGIFNTDGTNQTEAQTVNQNVTAVYNVRIDNDGNTSRTFLVKAVDGTEPGWTTVYKKGSDGTDITAAITSATKGYTTGTIDPNGSEIIRVEMTPGATALGGKNRDTLVQILLDKTDKTVRDAVRAVTTLNVLNQPDLLIQQADNSYQIQGTYQTTPSGLQIRSQSVNPTLPVTYSVHLQNAGNTNRTYVVKATESAETGWTVVYTNAAGTDISSAITGAGYTTASLTPVAIDSTQFETITVTMTPGLSVAPNTTHTATLNAYMDGGDTTVRDAVAAVTTANKFEQPDLLIQQADGSFAIDGSATNPAGYQTTPSGAQIRTQSVNTGVTVNCQVMVENDGNTTRTFLVKAAESPETGWAMAYTRPNGSVAPNITTTGYTTGPLAPGASEIILVQMTPDVTVVGNTSKSSTLTVFMDATDTTVRDAVRATSTVCRPDLLIKKTSDPDTAYIGNNVYETTPTTQVINQSADPNTVASYKIRVQNDGNTTTQYFVKTIESPGPGWTVVYKKAADGSIITNALMNSGYTTGNIVAGGNEDIIVEMTPQRSAVGGTTKTATFNVYYNSSDATVRDSAQATTTVNVINQPDLLIQQSDGTYAIDGLVDPVNGYQTTPAGAQIRTQVVDPNVKATYQVEVENDGNTAATFVVKAVESGETGWTIAYKKADGSPAAGMTGGGYTTGSLAPLKTEIITVEMTPDSTVVGNTSKTTTLKVFLNPGDTTVRDAVQAKTVASLYQPDLLIKLGGEPDSAYAIDGSPTNPAGYQTVPSGAQVRSQTVNTGVSAAYQVMVENDGNTNTTFVVKAVESADASWTITYTRQDGSATTGITGGGYTTSTLAPGANEIITVVMTPGSNVVGGTSKSTTLNVFLNGSDTTVRDAVQAITTVSRPDLLIKQSGDPDSAYAIQNVYQSTPSGAQIKSQTVNVNTAASYSVRIDNDGNTTRTYLLKAAESADAGWTVTYTRFDGTDITSQMKGGGYTTGSLSPSPGAGSQEVVTVQMTPSISAIGGTSKTTTINAYYDGSDTTVRDAVQAATTVNVVTQPDLLIKLDSEPDTAYAGSKIYETTPLADQTKSQTVKAGSTANSQVKVQNNGNTTRTFLVKAVESTDTGWIMAYTRADGSVAANITTTGYTTGSLAPGASEIILVQMTPGDSVVGGTSKIAVLNVFNDSSDTTVRDAVQATTIVCRPDLLIKLGTEPDSAYAINNVYQSTPSGAQARTQSVDRNTTANYQVKIENDGTTTRTYVARATESNETGWIVVYTKPDGTNVTSAIKGASGYTTGSLTPGGNEIITVQMTPGSAAVGGTNKTSVVAVFYDGSDTTVRDIVQATSTVNVVSQPDLLIKASSDPDTAYAIAGVYQTTPSGAQINSQTTTIGVGAGYQVKIDNDGNTTRTFVVKAVESSDTGWAVTYTKQDGTPITSAITGASGYTTGNLAPGANEVINVQMAPNNTVIGGTTKTTTLNAYLDGSDTTVRDAVQAVTTASRPDLLIKLGSDPDTAYAIPNVYQTNPAGDQVKAQSVDVNTKATYMVKVQNQGNVARTYVVKAVESAETGWTTAYKKSDGTAITTNITGAGYTTASLPAGGFEVLTVEITPGNTVPAGSSKTTTLSVFYDASDTTVRDVVQAVTTNNIINQPDLLVKLTSDPDSAYTGDHEYQTTPSGDQLKTQSVTANVKASYNVKVQNNGNVTRTFLLKSVESPETGWNVTYKRQTGAAITSNITGSGYTTISLLPGASEFITVEMTADNTVVGGTSKTSTVQVFLDKTDTTVRDAIGLTTPLITVNQPDALIKLTSEPDASYAMANVYQTTPSGDQVRTQSVDRNVTASYSVKIQNNGNTTRTFVVKTVEAIAPGWTINYIVGTTDIGSKIRDTGGWTTGNLAPNAGTVIRVDVTPGPDVGCASSASATLNAFLDGSDTTVRDSVKAATTINAPPAPTITSITPAEALNTGDIVTVTLVGVGFRNGDIVTLTKSGAPNPITARGVALSDPTKITCTLDLKGRETGKWDVVVTDPCGPVGTLKAGFFVKTLPPANDVCAGAIVIPVNAAPASTVYSPFNKQDTTFATSTGDPVPSCRLTTINGVWYQFTPPVSGLLSVDTIGSDFDTVLAIYSGSCGNLQEVACNDDGGPNRTSVINNLSVIGGTTYYFLGGGTAPDAGQLVLNLTFVPSAPPTVTSITPNAGTNNGSVTITNLAGTGFAQGATVKLVKSGLPDITAANVSVVNASQITCSFDLTGKAGGTYDVVVTNPDAQKGILQSGFTVNTVAPTVTGITPASGPNNAIVNITNLTGTGFVPGAVVKLTKANLPDIVGTNVTVVSSTQITCAFDLHGKTAGNWNVVVVNNDGKSGSLNNGFSITETNVVPHDVAVTDFSASPNPVARGQTVTFSVKLKNFGTSTESGVTFKITNNGKTLVGPIKIASWKPGQELSGTLRMTIPRNVPAGDYLVTGEVSSVPGETNTDNNKQTIKLTVQ